MVEFDEESYNMIRTKQMAIAPEHVSPAFQDSHRLNFCDYPVCR